MLHARGIPFAELPASPRVLRAIPGARTTPQVFADGRHIGGADELEVWLEQREGTEAG
jgi:glutaredoxin